MAANGFLPSDSNFSTRISTTGLDPLEWDSCIPDTTICMGLTHSKGWDSSILDTPVSLGSTHSQSTPTQSRKYLSSRDRNPTRETLESILASLEKGKFGVCFSPKLGGCVQVIARMLKAGDHLLTAGDEYGGAYRAFKGFMSESGAQTEFIDLVDVNAIHQRVKPNTKMLWIETPTNPLLTYVDLRAACEIAHQYKIIVVVDNTFLSPHFQKPLEFGADIVVHSLTEDKINNVYPHLLMGAAITNDKKIHKKLKFIRETTNSYPWPYDCYLIIRSLKFLQSHMERQMENSLKIALFLREQPLVEKVLHPALESHPCHQIAKKQTYGWGGTLAFYVKGGLEQSIALISHLKLFTMAECFPGYESSIKIPSVMTHAYLPAEEKLKLGITDNLIRVSVGLQSVDDLIGDLRRAFELLEDGNQAATSCSIGLLTNDFERTKFFR